MAAIGTATLSAPVVNQALDQPFTLTIQFTSREMYCLFTRAMGTQAAHTARGAVILKMGVVTMLVGFVVASYSLSQLMKKGLQKAEQKIQRVSKKITEEAFNESMREITSKEIKCGQGTLAGACMILAGLTAVVTSAAFK